MEFTFYGIEIETTPSRDICSALRKKYSDLSLVAAETFLDWFYAECDSAPR